MEPRYIVHHVDDDGVEQTESVTNCRDAEWAAKALRALGVRSWVVLEVFDGEVANDVDH